MSTSALDPFVLQEEPEHSGDSLEGNWLYNSQFSHSQTLILVSGSWESKSLASVPLVKLVRYHAGTGTYVVAIACMIPCRYWYIRSCDSMHA